MNSSTDRKITCAFIETKYEAAINNNNNRRQCHCFSLTSVLDYGGKKTECFKESNKFCGPPPFFQIVPFINLVLSKF